MPVRFRTRTALFAFALMLCPLALLAQPDCSRESAARVTMNMRDADIRSIIQWIAEQTGKQIVIDPRVKGEISILADRPMSIAQAYEVFLAALDVYGFAAAEVNGVLRIYPESLARSSATQVVRDFERIGQQGQVVHVMQPQNVSATALADLLGPLVPASGYLQALPASNSLVVADAAANVRRIVELGRQLDTSGDLDVDIIRLDHADAQAAADVIEGLEASAPNTGTPFSLAVDPRSNSLLLSGDPVRRGQVERLLTQLDRPIAETGGTRVVYLQYLNASELVPVLEGVSGSTQKASADAQVIDAAIGIQASESANAIVLSGPAPVLDRLEEVIGKLDIRRAQVLVEAVIVEVSQDYAQQLGVEWNTAFSGEGLEAATRFGISPPPPVDGSAVNPLASFVGTGLNLGLFRNGSLRALVRALENNSNANLLSTPSVLTLDNQEAEILVGSNIPLITGQVTGEAADVSNPFTTYEREDIGVSLKIRPQINRGDAITLDVLQVVETVAPSTLVENDIVTDKRSISTRVLVDDDAILVLGGLISDETREQERKVPVLGDIPLLGALFRSTEDQRIKRNLLVFIHPVIVDSEAVAEELSRERYEDARELQQKYLTGKFRELMREREVLPDYSTFEPRREAAASP